jgi:hypothetical protein
MNHDIMSRRHEFSILLLAGQIFGFEKPLTFETNGRNGKL